jgi:hypothetical protein
MRAFSQSSWLDDQVVALLRHKCYPGGYREILDHHAIAKHGKSISLAHDDQMFAFSDQRISEFAQKQAERLRAEGKLYDGPPALRLVQLQVSEDLANTKFSVQPCRYADQAGSSFLLNYPDALLNDTGGTLRTYLEQKYHPSQFMEQLPGCFGVCGMVITSDRKIPVPLRGRLLASMAHTWGPSVAGGVDYDSKLACFDDILATQLPIELDEELGLKQGEYSFTPASCALEGGRGMRPQLFAMITTMLDSIELLERVQSLPEDEREHDDLRWIRLDDPLNWSADLLQSLNYEAAYSLLAASKIDLN